MGVLWSVIPVCHVYRGLSRVMMIGTRAIDV